MDNSSLSLALSEPTSASKLEAAIRRGGRRLYGKAFDDEVHREATRMVTQHDGSVADLGS